MVVVDAYSTYHIFKLYGMAGATILFCFIKLQCMSCSLLLLFFFFNDTAPPEIYTLPLPDALPISRAGGARGAERPARSGRHDGEEGRPPAGPRRGEPSRNLVRRAQADRLRRGIVLVLRAEHRRHGDRGAPVRPPAEPLHAQRAGARARQAVRPDEVQRRVPHRAVVGPGRDADPVEWIQSGCAG